jgi:hypothetical protein
MFSYLTLEQRVPQEHPLREIRVLTDGVLQSLDPELDKLYAARAVRRSLPSMCCGRCCCRRFIRSVRSASWSSRSTTTCSSAGSSAWAWMRRSGTNAVFSKNRDRLLNSEVAQQFFAAVNQQAKRFMSDSHFTVDGTLIQAWASHKSFRAKDGSDSDDSDGANFHGQKRSNDTHESTTDPDARLYKKSYGKESHLAYLGHTLVENRNGLIAAAMVTQADGYAEREAALLMLQDQQKGRKRRITVGADKAYDTQDFLAATRALNVTAHVTKNEKGRRSNLDRRTTRHPGYALSLSRRWLVEKSFGWLKQTGPLRQVKLRGLHKVDWLFVFSCAAHNLMRLPKLIALGRQARPMEQCA